MRMMRLSVSFGLNSTRFDILEVRKEARNNKGDTDQYGLDGWIDGDKY